MQMRLPGRNEPAVREAPVPPVLISLRRIKFSILCFSFFLFPLFLFIFFSPPFSRLVRGEAQLLGSSFLHQRKKRQRLFLFSFFFLNLLEWNIISRIFLTFSGSWPSLLEARSLVCVSLFLWELSFLNCNFGQCGCWLDKWSIQWNVLLQERKSFASLLDKLESVLMAFYFILFCFF